MIINNQEIKDFGSLELLARQVVEGFLIGLHKSPFHGFSVEFAEHRIYNPGESTKNIDWKVYARTDKLFTKKFEDFIQNIIKLIFTIFLFIFMWFLVCECQRKRIRSK